MIAKRYRLNYRETKKALAHGKPFFAGGLTALALPGRAAHHRVAVVISGKNARGSVIRNFFRRAFFDALASRVLSALPAGARPKDVVMLAKRGTVLDHRNPASVEAFRRDLETAAKKAFSA